MTLKDDSKYQAFIKKITKLFNDEDAQTELFETQLQADEYVYKNFTLKQIKERHWELYTKAGGYGEIIIEKKLTPIERQEFDFLNSLLEEKFNISYKTVYYEDMS